MSSDPIEVILIAPNVSEQMGGEAIKSLQIFEILRQEGVPVRQITHGRVRDELSKRMPDAPIFYIDDDWLQRWMWKSKVLRGGIGVIFQWRAARLAESLAKDSPRAVVHINSPVSPVMPMFLPRNLPVVIGPVNGNIYYPPAMRSSQPRSWSFRQLLHPVVQSANRVLFAGRRRANVLLVAGGERTYHSLRLAGCSTDRLRESLDSGIPDRLRDIPRIVHQGPNYRFVHNGRLMAHKGCDLIIRALKKTRTPATLDIIGRGDDEPRLRALVAELGLTDRVNFLPWFSDHRQVAEALRAYRAFVLPSLAEANGIVVQEAMMLGLPSICLDWGGPALLLNSESGILVAPTGQEGIVAGLADAMDRLGEDAQLAERLSKGGRQQAIERGFSWSDLIQSWRAIYREVAGDVAPASARAVGVSPVS